MKPKVSLIEKYLKMEGKSCEKIVALFHHLQQHVFAGMFQDLPKHYKCCIENNGNMCFVQNDCLTAVYSYIKAQIHFHYYYLVHILVSHSLSLSLSLFY